MRIDARLAIDGGEPLRQQAFGPRWVFDHEDRDQLMAVMDRAKAAWRNGEKLRSFVNAFQKIFGVKNAVPTGSGTAAIHAAIGALNPDPGDEVITTPVTDIGTVLGLLQHNLIPVFADWAPGEFNTDPDDIERHITERTRVILVVHLFGFPCDMNAIMDIASRYDLAVIEDCAQAHLGEHDGRKLGTFGDLACWSFGLKTLTTDQGGMVSARDPAMAAEARGFLSKGSIKQDGLWVPYSRLGTFSPMTDLQAAVGLSQIRRLEDATRRRERVAEILDAAFAEIDVFSVPNKRSGDRNVYYMYPYHLDEAAAGIRLVDFIEALRAEGISDAFGPYLKGRPLHRHSLFTEANTYGRSGFPMRDTAGVVRVDYRAIHLPRLEGILPGLGFLHMRNSFTEQDGQDIADAICKVARGLGITTTSRSVGQREVLPQTLSRAKIGPSLETQVRASLPIELTLSRAGPRDPSEVLQSVEFVDIRPGHNAAADNDKRLAAAIAALEGHGGTLRLPSGEFHFGSPIQLQRRRNIRFVGSGGNLKDGGTRLIVKPATEIGGLDLKTAIHCQFENICFMGAPDAPGPVIALGCDEDGSDGTSSLSITFTDCTFRGPADSVGVWLRDCAVIGFERCWFMGCAVSARIGAPIRGDTRSVSNGLANTIVFDRCMIFECIEGIRASGLRFSSCHFSAATHALAAGIDCGATSHAEALNVTIVDCFAIEARGGTFFRQGSRGAGLVFQNNRIRGYDCAVEVDGLGGTVVTSNIFDLAKDAQSPVRITTTGECFLQGNIERR